MEFNEHGFFEGLLAQRRDVWDSIPTGMNEFCSNGWSNFECFEEYPPSVLPAFSEPPDQQSFGYSPELYYSQLGALQPPEINTDCPVSMVEDEDLGLLSNDLQSVEMVGTCKVEPAQSIETPVFDAGLCVERKNRAKKVEGQPSKNLMAERRRRKRLNDRLSMLRSVVPKISKMDRTSILGDTIDYMKELLEKINSLQEEVEMDSDQLNLMGIFNDTKSNEIMVRNSPKFAVERRNTDTRIEICCAGKPGLLLSTVSTLEALGLEIEQCVISCFNDFAVHASCSEELEQRTIISSEDIKQALFRNAGYGGRCL